MGLNLHVLKIAHGSRDDVESIMIVQRAICRPSVVNQVSQQPNLIVTTTGLNPLAAGKVLVVRQRAAKQSVHIVVHGNV